MTFRVVFDTNIVISALVFPTGDLTWLRGHWKREQVLPLVSKATTEELIRVLAYPKFKLEKEDIEILLSDYLPYTEIIEIPAPTPDHPKCRDADDQKFIDLAITGNANIIVSGDQDILSMNIRGIYTESFVEYRARFEVTESADN